MYYHHSIYEETGQKHIICTVSKAKLLSAQIDKKAEERMRIDESV